MKLSPKLSKFTVSGAREVFELARKHPDVINLGLGDVDFDTPANVRDAAKRALDEGFTHYTSTSGLPELRAAIAARLRRRTGVSFDPETQIMVTLGATQAILDAMITILAEGEEALVPTPAFSAYQPTVHIAGGVPVDVPCLESNGFRPNVEDLKRKATDKTRVLFLNSPCNPTGALLTRKDLEELADYAVENDLIVVSDEVYDDLQYEGDHVSIAGLHGMEERTIVINSFSKCYAMTGWRIGYAAGPEGILKEMLKVQVYNSTCPVSFAQKAAIEALTGPQHFYKEMRFEYDARRRRTCELIGTVDGLTLVEPRGGIFVFPSIRSLGLTSRQVAERLVDKAKVAVVPGDSFGSGGEGYLRITYSAPIPKLEEAVSRIKAALATIKA